jgi:hypothetical protein
MRSIAYVRSFIEDRAFYWEDRTARAAEFPDGGPAVPTHCFRYGNLARNEPEPPRLRCVGQHVPGSPREHRVIHQRIGIQEDDHRVIVSSRPQVRPSASTTALLRVLTRAVLICGGNGPL